MEIAVFYDDADELWGIFTHGHVDKVAFLDAVEADPRAAEALHQHEGNIRTVVLGEQILHTYMRCTRTDGDESKYARALETTPEAIAITIIPGDCF